MADRAVVFIDGNNWFHSLKNIDVANRGRLNYGKISEKLVGPREWVATRYYIGRVRQKPDKTVYAAQRHFLSSLSATDKRITFHLGRLEPRRVDDPAANALRKYLANLSTKIDAQVYKDLNQIARDHQNATALVEKAVDVMLAVDLVVMAERKEFDAAYLLSADGDFTPAVRAVREHGEKVYAVSPGPGAELGAVVNSFIRLKRGWFDDCY